MLKHSGFTIAFTLLLIGIAACASAQSNSTQPTSTTGSISIQADVWADNWFAFYLADTLVKEDSVAITTERSFNKESFSFKADYPLVLNFIAKDFKENDTGLEYIGSNRQQMGDGGLIAQFKDADSGELIAVTNSDWQCLVIHEAPLDKSCEKSTEPSADCAFTSQAEPEGWMSAEFDSSSWSSATEYSEAAVSPKEGYDQVSWDASAKLIWGDDLETNNTLLCKLVVSP